MAHHADGPSVARAVVRMILDSGIADRAVFLVPDDNRLAIAAAGTMTSAGVVMSEQPVSDELPWSVVSFVRRSNQTLGLARAAEPHAFSADDYFAAHRPASLACLPVLREQEAELMGALYVESRSTRDAFGAQRSAFLEILVAHAAVTLAHLNLVNDRRNDAATSSRQE